MAKKLFGTSSKKHIASIQEQMSLFDAEDPADMETLPPGVREHRCRPKRTLEEKFKGIPVEEVIVEGLLREEKICPDCARKWCRWVRSTTIRNSCICLHR